MTNPDSYKAFKINRVSFISFNYDRSLEHFLHESLINSFSSIPPLIDGNELIPFPFLHVYGVVSKLPWQDKICFRYREGLPHIQKMTENIKIIYDRASAEEFNIENLLLSSDRIIFLGFGYAKENLDVLGINDILMRRVKNRPKNYGTALNFTERELNDVYSYFPDSYEKRNFDLRKVKSLTLLQEIL